MTDEVRQEDRELLPCAFCGGEAKLGGFKLAPDGYWISCQQKPCCASIDCFDTKEAAIAVWNASPLRTRIAELERMLAEAREALEPFAAALLSKHGQRT